MDKTLEQFQPAQDLVSSLDQQIDSLNDEQKDLLTNIKASIDANNFDVFKLSVKQLSSALPQNLQNEVFKEAANEISNVQTETQLHALLEQVSTQSTPDITSQQPATSVQKTADINLNESKDEPVTQWGKTVQWIRKNPLKSTVIGTAVIGAGRKIRGWITRSKEEKAERKKRTKWQKVKDFVKDTVMNGAAAALGVLGIEAWRKISKESKDKDNSDKNTSSGNDIQTAINKKQKQVQDKVTDYLSGIGVLTPDPEHVSEEELESRNIPEKHMWMTPSGRIHVVGDNGKVDVFTQQEFMHQQFTDALNEYVGPDIAKKMELLKVLVDIRAERAMQVSQSANRIFTSKREKNLLHGNAQKVDGMISKFGVDLIAGNLGNKDTIASTANQLIEDIKKIILTTEGEKGVIGESDMKKAFDALESSDEHTFEQKQLAMLDNMRGTYGGRGNSSGIERLLTDQVIDEGASYTKLKELLHNENDLEKVFDALKTGNSSSLSDILQNTLPLSANTCSKMATTLLKDYTSIEVYHTKNKQHYVETIRKDYENVNDIDDGQTADQRILTAYNTRYGENETNVDKALRVITDEMIENAVIASFLAKLKYRSSFQILKSRSDEQKNEKEKILDDMMGVGFFDVSDTNTKRVMEMGVNVGLCLIPMGAGMVAARVASSAVRAGGTLIATSQRLSKIGKIVSGGIRATKITSTGARIAGMGLKAGFEGAIFYETQNVVNNFLYHNENVREGRDNNEALLQSIALMGIGNNVQGILKGITGLAKKYGITKILPSTKIMPQQMKSILAETSVLRGGYGGVDYLINQYAGDGSKKRSEIFTFQNFIVSLGMTALFRRKNRLDKRDISYTKQNGSLIQRIGTIRKSEKMNKLSLREKRILNKHLLPKVGTMLKHMENGQMKKVFGINVSKVGKKYQATIPASKQFTKQDLQGLHSGVALKNNNGSLIKTNGGYELTNSAGVKTSYTKQSDALKQLNKSYSREYGNATDLMRHIIPNAVARGNFSFTQVMLETGKSATKNKLQNFRSKQTLKLGKGKNAEEYIVKFDAKGNPTFASKVGSKTITPGTPEWQALGIKLEGKLVKSSKTIRNRVKNQHAMLNTPVADGFIKKLPKNLQSQIKDRLIATRGGIEKLLFKDILNAWDDILGSKGFVEGLKNTGTLILGKGGKHMGWKRFGQVNRVAALTQIVPPLLEGDYAEAGMDTLIRGMLLRGIPSKVIGWMLGIKLDVPEIVENAWDETKGFYEAGKNVVDNVGHVTSIFS